MFLPNLNNFITKIAKELKYVIFKFCLDLLCFVWWWLATCSSIYWRSKQSKSGRSSDSTWKSKFGTGIGFAGYSLLIGGQQFEKRSGLCRHNKLWYVHLQLVVCITSLPIEIMGLSNQINLCRDCSYLVFRDL